MFVGGAVAPSNLMSFIPESNVSTLLQLLSVLKT